MFYIYIQKSFIYKYGHKNLDKTTIILKHREYFIIKDKLFW
jgi:hypothetical protein